MTRGPLTPRQAMNRQAMFLIVGVALMGLGVRLSNWLMFGAGVFVLIVFGAAFVLYALRFSQLSVGNTSSRVAPASRPEGTALVFTRSSDGDRARKYGIVVDGTKVGTLSPGASLAVAVSPGHHTYRAKIDWSGSPEYNANLEDSEQVNLLVSRSDLPDFNSKTGWLTISRR